MAILAGNNGRVLIDNAAGTLTAVAAVRTFSVEITSDTIESTAMGNDTRQYIKGLSSWSGTADIYFDNVNLTGGASVIAALLPTSIAVGAAPITVELYLGSTGGTDNNTANKFSGECIITGYTVNSSMDGMVEASISFQGSGACTFTA
jgi:predicted secreted protein